ncbi:hypothetical protein NC652_027223 [Populus alba x Populus x berolinensis]|nr:hypothetical protein NC652_027223 [Populus alba x Populus x berolinensis]
MRREIARQESPKCQRVWHHMEAFTTLPNLEILDLRGSHDLIRSPGLEKIILENCIHLVLNLLIELQGNRFNVVLEYDENEMLEFYVEEGLIQKEFEEHMSFKISSPGTHRICGFNLFTWFSGTPVSYPYLHVYLQNQEQYQG